MTAAVSPDGRRVVYVDARCRTWLLDRRTLLRRRLPNGRVPGSFSPDGRLLALERRITASDGPGADVILYRANGKRLAAIVGNREEGGYVEPTWSADGRWLLVTFHDSGTHPRPSRLYAYSTATGRSTRVARGFAAVVAGADGRVVLGGKCGADGRCELVTARLVE